jgi:hypothetical protein
MAWAEETLPFTFTFTNYAPGCTQQGTDTTSSIEADCAGDRFSEEGCWSSHDGSRQCTDAVRELRHITVNTTDDELALRDSFKKFVRFSTRCDRLANWCYQKRAWKGLHLMSTHPLLLVPIADLELRHRERCETAMDPEGKWVYANCSDILGMGHTSAVDLAIYAKIKLPYSGIQCFDCHAL